jgi:uncharacterized coiled-coil protein SlyX
MKNRKTIFTAILLALRSFALSQIAQAVVPAPDGGYPGANTAEGQNALLGLTSGTFNTAVGWFALRSDTTGQFNTALGGGTLLANIGDQNTATGAGALLSNTTGFNNTANGAFALFNNAGGAGNTATGTSALFSNATGGDNTANGIFALIHNIGGSSNTAIGLNALVNNTSGNNNIALGAGAGSNVVTASNTICIGIAGVDVTDGCYIGHVFEEPLDPDNLTMAIDVNGKVGTLASSRRFKDHIKPMDKTSESILGLKPVTFHYKNDKKCSPRFGLIAEEVADVDPNLVARDKEGKPYSVRYDQVNAMLLNEFLKDHKKVEAQQIKISQQEATIAELESTVAQQQKGMEALSAQLKEQATQIQNVSAQVEISKPASKVVANRP